MFIKQISVFVENKSGRLAEITAILAKANIDIRALSVADTTHFGILRLIVNRPDAAEEALLHPVHEQGPQVGDAAAQFRLDCLAHQRHRHQRTRPSGWICPGRPGAAQRGHRVHVRLHLPRPRTCLRHSPRS